MNVGTLALPIHASRASSWLARDLPPAPVGDPTEPLRGAPDRHPVLPLAPVGDSTEPQRGKVRLGILCDI